MAFSPAGYQSTTAGDPEASLQTWTPASTNDANGNQYLTNGLTGANIRYIYWWPGPRIYVLGPVLGDGGASVEYTNNGQSTLGTFPLTGWTVSNGVAPAPQFNPSSSAAPPQNLTMAVVY